MAEDDKFDLFRQPQQKKKESPFSEKKEKNSVPLGEVPSDEEIKKMIDKMSGIYQEIRENISGAFSSKGFSPEQLTDFLKDSKNFNNEQWQIIQEERDKLEKDLWQQIGEERKKGISEKRKKLKKKKVKGKTLGARKKWIDTR